MGEARALVGARRDSLTPSRRHRRAAARNENERSSIQCIGAGALFLSSCVAHRRRGCIAIPSLRRAETTLSADSIFSRWWSHGCTSLRIDQGDFAMKLIPLLATVGLGVLLARPVDAGSIYFTRFTVYDCNEMGTCDWKLHCNTGDEQASLMLLNNREANSGESLTLNRTIDFSSLPIVLACELFEHDGGIGAAWEPIGAERITIRRGGQHALEFYQNPDEGTAGLEFSVNDTNSGQQGLGEAPTERFFIGTFRAGTDGHYLLTGISRATLDAEWNRLSGVGLRLVDVSSYEDAGNRRYNAVFRQGGGAHALIIERTWAQFSTDWQRALGEGLQLIDLEVTGVGDARRYTGVFRAGTGGQYLTPALRWDAFVAKRDALAAQGLRLVDLETFVQGGKRYYHGAFLPGSDAHFLWNVKGWAAFEAKWRELSAAGLRLVDVETYGSGANRHFVAVYRQGSDAYAMYAANGTDFIKQWDAMSKQGLRLIQMETWKD
jgi:hypothetical protein